MRHYMIASSGTATKVRKHEIPASWVSCFRVFVALISAAICVAVPQGAGPQAPQQPTFRASTRLIVTTVVVKDRDGKPIEGLTAKDFLVTEDNEAQDVAFVEYQRLEDQPPLPPLSSVQVADVAAPDAAGA